MLSGIAEGTSEVSGFLASEDCLASLAAMRALGVRIEQPSATHVLIHGVGCAASRMRSNALDMGNAGTAMRLFTGLLAAQDFDSRLIGDASLMKRPMERVAKPLREMGARCAHAQRHAAGRYRRRSPPARHRVPHAGGERAGQVGDPAGGALCRRRHHRDRAGRLPRPQRAHADELRRARDDRGSQDHLASAAAARKASG